MLYVSFTMILTRLIATITCCRSSMNIFRRLSLLYHFETPLSRSGLTLYRPISTSPSLYRKRKRITSSENWPSQPTGFLSYNNIIYPPTKEGEPKRPAEICHQKTNIKHSQKKMWYAAVMVRGMPIDEAIKQAGFLGTKAGAYVKLTLEEAQRKAVEEFHVEFASNLWVETSLVGRAPSIRGFRRQKGMRNPDTGLMVPVEYVYCHYLVRLREGRPPDRYYEPAGRHVSAWQKLDQHLKALRSQEVGGKMMQDDGELSCPCLNFHGKIAQTEQPAPLASTQPADDDSTRPKPSALYKLTVKTEWPTENGTPRPFSPPELVLCPLAKARPPEPPSYRVKHEWMFRRLRRLDGDLEELGPAPVAAAPVAAAPAPAGCRQVVATPYECGNCVSLVLVHVEPDEWYTLASLRPEREILFGLKTNRLSSSAASSSSSTSTMTEGRSVYSGLYGIVLSDEFLVDYKPIAPICQADDANVLEERKRISDRETLACKRRLQDDCEERIGRYVREQHRKLAKDIERVEREHARIVSCIERCMGPSTPHADSDDAEVVQSADKLRRRSLTAGPPASLLGAAPDDDFQFNFEDDPQAAEDEELAETDEESDDGDVGDEVAGSMETEVKSAQIGRLSQDGSSSRSTFAIGSLPIPIGLTDNGGAHSSQPVKMSSRQPVTESPPSADEQVDIAADMERLSRSIQPDSYFERPSRRDNRPFCAKR